MSVIRLGGFSGQIPRLHPRLLPSGAAQQADNCRMDSGALESLRDTLNIQSTSLSNPLSLFRYSDTIWLEAITDVDWVSYPVVDDQFGRVIFADPSASDLRVTDASLVGTGGYPANYYRLDVPAPTQGFSATLQGVANDTDEVPETRFYVCTFVNSWGAEGPPSPPSNQVEWRTGQTVLLERLPSVPTGNYNITHRRVYRINTGSTGTTEYQFVTEVSVTQTQIDVQNIIMRNPIEVTAIGHGFTDGTEVKLTGLGPSGVTTAITGISKNAPCRVLAPGHGLPSAGFVELDGLGGANGMDELQGVRALFSYVNDDNIDLITINSTNYTTYVSGGTIELTYGADELDDTQHVIAVRDANRFTLVGVDGTDYKSFSPYAIGTSKVEQVSGNSYTDTIASGSLGEVLPTELYDPPNTATLGIKVHPSGFLVGFFGKTVACSEPGAPHAWPIDYRRSTSHDIVGLGVFGNTVAVVTKGWPYLLVGSDPAAMNMIELEIDQACVSKRGIVDFGTAIVYPSPDGLILLSNEGAQNVSGALFTRDQWQALVPTTFVAFDWEKKYLCFYDDGTSQKAFLLDPFAPENGVRYVDKYVTGGYKDLEEDLLYCISSNQIVSWDQGVNLQYTWKSAPTYTPRAVNMSAAKVFADDYPVTVDFYVDDVKRHTRIVQAGKAFRLPGGFKGEKFEVVLKGKRRVSEVIMATTMRELSLTV